ncbi:MAG: hypothetical protein R3A52_28440 [Polyangiales bacterium]
MRDGRVVALRDPVFVRQGPRIGEAARRVAEALHPATSEDGVRAP